MQPEVRSHQVKQLAQELGFEQCGLARAERLDDDARRLENWLRQGFHGSMQYMENHFDLRTDPTRLVPGARSVITLLYNYYPEQTQSENAPKVARYAWGEDYHTVIREKLHVFLARLRELFGEIEGRGFVDSAPVLERSWAQRSGIGWIGKNGNLINRQQGSYCFIATLITDLELAYDNAYAKDYCGTCTRCIDACPTEAILPDKQIDGSRCISYFTIELKAAIIPESMQGKWNDWIFGCDVCQEVCPWNRFAQPHTEPRFQPVQEILAFNLRDWQELTEEAFQKIFRHSPIKRSKFSGMQRNLRAIQTTAT
ncbi:MAG TPA: tRNA epoxyqueuosine(34) reductase QueG [Ferruginibacter sp.]|nr:tRNA epoxyqueuosine(34) reductase QueG [Ferruginibacter sp.]